MNFDSLPKLQRDLMHLQSFSVVNNFVRRHFSEDGDLTSSALKIGAKNYLLAQDSFPAIIEWRICDHSAFITRLYALYESYVLDLVRKWLVFLPTAFPKWDDLPDPLCNNYRSGVGVLLQKYGGPRTNHLTVESIVGSIHNGLSGNPLYHLIPEAFFLELPNLREDDIIKLLNKVGVTQTKNWLNDKSSPLGEFCQSNSCTVASKLKEFIGWRNDCSHKYIEIVEVLGLSELKNLSEFVLRICQTLTELILHNMTDYGERVGHYERLGTITEYLPKPDANIVKMHKVSISKGEDIFFKNDTSCRSAKINSIQENGVELTSIFSAEGSELGIKFSEKIEKGSIVLRRIQAAIKA